MLPYPSAIAPALLLPLAPASLYRAHPWTRTTYIPVGNASGGQQGGFSAMAN